MRVQIPPGEPTQYRCNRGGTVHVFVDIMFAVYGLTAVVLIGIVIACWISSARTSRIHAVSEHDQDVAEALAASE